MSIEQLGEHNGWSYFRLTGLPHERVELPAGVGTEWYWQFKSETNEELIRQMENGDHHPEDQSAPDDTFDNDAVVYRVPVTSYALKTPVPDGKIAQAETKVPFSYIPFRALKGVARTFGYGRRKYAPGNFLKAAFEDGAPDRYVSAGLRHLVSAQRMDGTWDRESLATRDDESGMYDLDMLITGLIMMRAILTKDGILDEDPGMGKEPKK